MKYKLIIDKDAEEKTARSIIWVLGSKLFCLVWICYQSRLSEAVRGNFAKQSYKRTQFACRFDSSPTGGAKKKALASASAFFN